MLVENYDKVKELMAELERCKQALAEWEDCVMVIGSKTGYPSDIDRINLNSDDREHELYEQAAVFSRSCQIFYKNRIKEIKKQIEFL